jgi:Tyrosine phosphatase family
MSRGPAGDGPALQRDQRGPTPPMTAGRHLDWEGCLNVRDLGGLPAAGGRVTRWGAVVRSDSPAGLTPAGWSALRAHGIRTIVDLRNDDERTTHSAAAGLDTVHVPLDDLGDTEFWRRIWDDDLDGTAPLLPAVPGAQGGAVRRRGGGRGRRPAWRGAGPLHDRA